MIDKTIFITCSNFVCTVDNLSQTDYSTKAKSLQSNRRHS